MKIEFFVSLLKKIGINTIAGIPDSTLKTFCDYLVREAKDMFQQYTPSNEGAAIGLAVGSYLATGQPACVYMQNSGLGNAVNPLTSIAHKDVYDIPILLIVGWRGEPGIKDEPQHKYMGMITESLIKELDIKYSIFSSDMTDEEAKNAFEDAQMQLQENKPYCLLVKRGTFEKREVFEYKNDNKLVREDAIKCIVKFLKSEDVVFSTTGKISREIYECSDKILGHHKQTFLTVGGMGHASMIALGFAEKRKDKKVYCIDGDGAVFMHMGNLAYIAHIKPQNFVHICLNNFAHESVGGMATGLENKQYIGVAEEFGYDYAYQVKSKEELEDLLEKISNKKGAVFIEVLVSLESREDLGRPKEKAVENKVEFMNYHK